MLIGKLCNEEESDMSKWFLGAAGALVGLTVAFAGVVVLLWLLRRLWEQEDGKDKTSAIEIEVAEPEPPAEPLPADAIEAETVEAAVAELETGPKETAPPTPDDLTRIEGIGPKIAGVLQAAGISTFAQLAEADPEQLSQILHEADPRLGRLADPGTWPEQAALAAGEEWEAHKALTESLRGGRRV